MSNVTGHMFPAAFLHIDGDSFFVSCEQALNPSLRGLPVVTGEERGIASAMSYEAKALGVTRGMPVFKIRRQFPQVVILPSDYETYSLFAERMYEIVRRFSYAVEEYSIDECFASLAQGDRVEPAASPAAIAHQIKATLQGELGITFSVGLGPTKVLAKVASKINKPNGFTVIYPEDIFNFIDTVPAEKVWGIGWATAASLRAVGIQTAGAFARQSADWVRRRFSKPGQELWCELRGQSVLPVITHETQAKSIQKTRTFTPASSDREFVFSQLSKNIENACIKARRLGLITSRIHFFLKTQEFRYRGLELRLPVALSVPHEIVNLVRSHFDQVYRPKVRYRASGITLLDLVEEKNTQTDFFDAAARVAEEHRLFQAVDRLAGRYGKHTVFLASSFQAMHQQHSGVRATKPAHLRNRFPGENRRKRVGVPVLGEVT